MNRNNNKQPVVHASVPLQETSIDIWGQKYRLRDADSTPIDADVEASQWRTAQALAASEKPAYLSLIHI